MVCCPYGVFVSVFEPVDPVFGFCIMNHLGVLVARLAVLFMEGMAKVVLLGELVDFVDKFAYFGALLLEVRGPPSFLVTEWFGEGDVFVDDSVEGVLEVFEGCLEFADGVEGVGMGRLLSSIFISLMRLSHSIFCQLY